MRKTTKHALTERGQIENGQVEKVVNIREAVAGGRREKNNLAACSTTIWALYGNEIDKSRLYGNQILTR